MKYAILSFLVIASLVRLITLVKKCYFIQLVKDDHTPFLTKILYFV